MAAYLESPPPPPAVRLLLDLLDSPRCSSSAAVLLTRLLHLLAIAGVQRPPTPGLGRQPPAFSMYEHLLRDLCRRATAEPPRRSALVPLLRCLCTLLREERFEARRPYHQRALQACHAMPVLADLLTHVVEQRPEAEAEGAEAVVSQGVALLTCLVLGSSSDRQTEADLRASLSTSFLQPPHLPDSSRARLPSPAEPARQQAEDAVLLQVQTASASTTILLLVCLPFPYPVATGDHAWGTAISGERAAAAGPAGGGPLPGRAGARLLLWWWTERRPM